MSNRQRTSPNHGILKSEAVYDCAKILADNGIATITDFQDAMKSKEEINALEVKFTSVRGRGSGISFAYLKMLCGDGGGIKPDRHILRFLSRYWSEHGSCKSCKVAAECMTATTNELNRRRAASGQSRLTNRELDYIVWSHMNRCRCR